MRNDWIYTFTETSDLFSNKTLIDIFSVNDDNFGLLLTQSYAAGECLGVTKRGDSIDDSSTSRSSGGLTRSTFKWRRVSQVADDW